MGELGGYTLLEELGRGGMGVVYRASSPGGEPVALKVLELAAALDPELALRFRLEAEAGRALDHPGIARVLDVGQDGGALYLALELLEGPNLQQLLTAEGPLEPLRAAALVQSLAEALAHAHERGILHRDLKPANVVLTARGPVLTDLGLAKLLDHHGASLTTTGEVLGTPAYMAPEQAAGEKLAIGPRTDVYGLGATLYALLTGRPPFTGPTPVRIMEAVLERDPRPPSAWRRDLPPALDAICLRCLAKAPAARFPTARAVAQALADVAVSEPLGRPPRPAAAAIALLVILAAGGGLSAALLTRQPVSQPSGSTTPSLGQAQRLVEAGAFAAALPLFEARLVDHPDELPSLLGLGACLLETTSGRAPDVAQRLLDLAAHVLRLDPGNADARVLEADARWRFRSEYAAAEALLAGVLAEHPAHFVARLTRAQLALMRGEQELAERELDLATALRPDDLELGRTRGTLYQRTGRLAKAEQVLRDLLERHPTDGLAQAYLGMTLVDADRFAEAAELLASAGEGTPLHPDVWAIRARAESELRHDQLALDCCERALTLDPDHTLALALRPVLLLRLSRRDEALQALRAHLARQPTDAAGWLLYGEQLRADGELAEARRALERTLELAPDQPRALEALATVYVRLKRFPEALRQLERLLPLQAEPSSRFVTLRRRGVLHRELEELEAARDCFARARELRPDHAQVVLDLATLLSRLGDTRATEEALRAYVELVPGQADAWSQLSRARLELGDRAGALEALDAFLRLAPDDPHGEFSRAYVLALEGQTAAAREIVAALPAARRSLPECRAVEALLCVREGEPARALELVAEGPTLPLTLYVRGEASRQLGRLEEARDLLRTYLQIQPPHHLAREARHALEALGE